MVTWLLLAVALAGPAPHVGDCAHFVLYYSEPQPNDPAIIGACRAGVVNFVNQDDGTVNLTYFPARQTNEPDNPPAFVEFKFRRHHAWPIEVGENGTWHYCTEHVE